MKKPHSLFIILLLTLNTYGQYFKEHHIITSGSLPNETHSLAVADFNNDGEQDIIACSQYIDYIYYLENKGNGEFNILKKINLILGELNELGYADINNDGLTDIVFSRYDYFWQLGWLKNMGNNEFRFGGRIFKATSSGWITVSFDMHDMNGDGFTDAVIGCNTHEYSLEIELNNGDGTFSDTTVSLIDEGQFIMYKCVDFDHDGDTDVVFNSKYPYQFVVALNDGVAGFSEKIVVDSNYLDMVKSFEIFDPDGDGDYDIMGVKESDSVILYRNDGNNRFTNIPVQNDSAVKIYKLRAVDVDKDGDADLVANYHDIFLENTGNNVFSIKKHDKISLFYLGNENRDINKNGIEDLVYGYRCGSVAYIADASLDNLTHPKMLTSQVHCPKYPAYLKINDDEFPDICLYENYDYIFYINNGHGEFSNADTFTFNRLHKYSDKSCFYDIDHDGFGDIVSYSDKKVYSGWDSCNFIFAKNNHDYTFTKIIQDDSNYYLQDRIPYFTDLNNDSALEVVMTEDYPSYGTDTILIFNINPDFTAGIHDSIIISHPVNIKSIHFYDFDGNGQKDILINDEYNLLVNYSVNNLFPDHFDTIFSSDETIIDFVPAHVTGDTISDILFITQHYIQVLENFNGTSFEKTFQIPIDHYPRKIYLKGYAEDLDNDGIDEISLVANGVIDVLHFDGDQDYSFERYSYKDIVYPLLNESFIFPDIDLDGDPDLLCSYSPESDLSWFENSLIDTIGYTSFPENNAVWTEQNTTYEGDSSLTWTSLYVTESDTVISNNSYTNIYEYYLNPETFDTIRKLYASVRQDKLEKKVYIIRHYLSENREKLLLDFKVNTGDTVVLGAYYRDTDTLHTDSLFVVDSIVTKTLYDSEKRDVLYLSNRKEQNPVALTLTEGVGSIQNPFGPVTNVTDGEQFCCPDYLICQTVNDEPVYVFDDESRCNSLEVWTSVETQSRDKLFNIYPNPVRDNLNIIFRKNLSSDFELAVYDIHGKLVDHLIGNANDNKIVIKTEHYGHGIYLLRIKYNGGLYSSKFVILK